MDHTMALFNYIFKAVFLCLDIVHFIIKNARMHKTLKFYS